MHAGDLGGAVLGDGSAVVLPAPCSRCRGEPRLPRQRWGRRCLTAAQRDRRAAKRAERGPIRGNSVPSVPAHNTANSDQPAVAQDGVTQSLGEEALTRYRRAVAELARVTRETDWRRWRGA